MDKHFYRRQSDASRGSSNNLSSSPSSHALDDLLPRPYSDVPPSRDRSLSSNTESRFPAYSAAPPSHRSRSQNKRVQISIPPPITASVLLPAINLTSSSVSSTQTLTPRLSGRNLAPLIRKERALQAEIQELLDAQSAGLLRGRAPKPQNGSRSTSKSPPKPATTPRTLHTARLGILRALHSLLELSQTKHSILLTTHTTLQSTLRQLTHWQRKLADLDSKIHALSPPPTSTSAPHSISPHRNQSSPRNENSVLRNDLPTIDREISNLEARLYTLRTHRRLLARALLEQRSRHEAQASSWVGAKREVEAEVSSWLRRPTEALSLDGEVAGETQELDAFLALPPGRRTLGGAIEAVRAVMAEVAGQMESIEREGDAVEKGAGVWEGVLERVLTFEKELRGWMKGGGAGAERVLERMGGVGREIEGCAEVAEREGWTLLVCAIGAELEAWREGEGVLKGVVRGFSPEGTKEGGVSNTSSPPQPLTRDNSDVKGKGKRVDNFNSSMGSDGTDVWGSALDTPNPAPNEEESTSHADNHSPDALSASEQRGRPRSLSPTPSPSPTYSRPRSPSPDPDPDFNIELEGLKLSGGTPTTRSPAFGSAVGMGESRFVEPLKRDGGRYRDNDGDGGGEDEEDDEGPGLDLLTEVVGEGYRDDEEDEGPGDDLLVSPKEK